MPSVQKTAKGYRVQVYVKGVRDSQTFRTRREADAWASARETELRADNKKTPGEKHTLFDALKKYGEEVSPKKRGSRWEQIRLKAFESMLPNLPINSVEADHMAAWRDVRLREVSAGTVLREISLLSDVLEIARIEWKWIPNNPLRDIRKPARPDHRSTLISASESIKMLRAMGHHSGNCKSVSQAVSVAFLLALRTGMRAKEICTLTWENVKDGYCILPTTKTKPRNVPLTWKAQRLIEQMRGWDDVLVFGIKTQTLDALFRKYRAKAGLSGFTFHDTRHTAATWISRKIDILDLCKMFGWSDTRNALVYYNPKAQDIARRISPKPDQSR